MMNMKMVIVVDSNAAYRNKIEDVLTRAGFVVFPVPTWREIYAHSHNRPDMVIIGEMPTDEDMNQSIRMARQLRCRMLSYDKRAAERGLSQWDRHNLNDLPAAVHSVFASEHEEQARIAAASRFSREKRPRRRQFARM